MVSLVLNHRGGVHTGTEGVAGSAVEFRSSGKARTRAQAEAEESSLF